MSSFARIHSELASDEPLVAATLAAPESITASGPTAVLHSQVDEQMEVGVEAIREGHLLHWGEGRLVTTTDRDLALLAGDRLYALGLERVAATQNEDAIIELSRLIKASATAMAERAEAVSEQAWTATCARIGALDS